MQAVALDFFEQLVHAALLGDFLLLLLLPFALRAALPPALPEIGPRPASSGRRLIALQTRIALGEVVPQERIFAPSFQNDPLRTASHLVEKGQPQRPEFVAE